MNIKVMMEISLIMNIKVMMEISLIMNIKVMMKINLKMNNKLNWGIRLNYRRVLNLMMLFKFKMMRKINLTMKNKIIMNIKQLTIIITIKCNDNVNGSAISMVRQWRAIESQVLSEWSWIEAQKVFIKFIPYLFIQVK
jgi:hypothetical protein